jgi:transposase
MVPAGARQIDWKYQSGEKDVTGGITRTGDEMVRTALYEAANVLLSRITRFSKLKRWGMDVAKRRGSKRAKVALARKIGVNRRLRRFSAAVATSREGAARQESGPARPRKQSAGPAG